MPQETAHEAGLPIYDGHTGDRKIISGLPGNATGQFKWGSS